MGEGGNKSHRLPLSFPKRVCWGESREREKPLGKFLAAYAKSSIFPPPLAAYAGRSVPQWQKNGFFARGRSEAGRRGGEGTPYSNAVAAAEWDRANPSPTNRLHFGMRVSLPPLPATDCSSPPPFSLAQSDHLKNLSGGEGGRVFSPASLLPRLHLSPSGCLSTSIRLYSTLEEEGGRRGGLVITN